MKDHHPAMLAAGWRMERDLFGGVTWCDPTADWRRWSDADARLHWNAGDRPGVPRIRRPEMLEEAQ